MCAGLTQWHSTMNRRRLSVGMSSLQQPSSLMLDLSPRSTGRSCWTTSGCHSCATSRLHTLKEHTHNHCKLSLNVLLITLSPVCVHTSVFLYQVAIPMTGGLDPVLMLTDGAMVAQWNNEGLPGDKMSTQNATILTNCEHRLHSELVLSRSDR